jgi:hypothetical protein
MDGFEYLKPNFPADAFAGTATYYVQYRIPYPQQLRKDLIERAGIRGAAGFSTWLGAPGG